MTRPRKEQISIQDTPYYHVVSRCVRRMLLCGQDPVSGKNYEHRRQWVEDRIRILSSLFAIDICAYAVMCNHLHIVVKLNPAEVETLSNEDVVRRWTSLFRGPLLVQRWLEGASLHPSELQAVNDCIAVYRRRLSSLSWFMKCLNEPIARQANKEDGCTGHFWESRYKSQALLTKEALLSCMCYVDLNPIRACMAKTPEESAHTSIKERMKPRFNLIEAVHKQIKLEALIKFNLPLKPLAQFEGSETSETQNGLPLSTSDYFELVDFTGRILRSDKCGAIPENLPAIVQRLQLDEPTWLENVTQFERNYRTKFSKQRRLTT